MNFTAVTSVHEVGERDWNSCALAEGHNPFVSFAFLSALEDSGSATAKSGWLGQHLVARDDGGEIRGIVPCYLKYHSQGEYVFDHSWAEAIHRAGGQYYPKLQASVPFTPVTGPRLLTRDVGVKPLLLEGLIALCQQGGSSSVHITFPTEREWEMADESHWLKRQDLQFHWSNPGYESFDDFLATLSSSKRKNIRKERRAVADAGITFEWASGDLLTPHHWDAFFAFYMDTGSRKWGRPYLNRKFFTLASERMAKRIVLITAFRAGKPIAGALNFVGGGTLFGRNWGCIEQHPFLHFETCYYQAMDFAIAHKLARVEAGAQGEHKLARGYLPTKTYSLHHIRDQRLARAVEDYLERERRAVDVDQQELAAHAPYRNLSDDGDSHDL